MPGGEAPQVLNFGTVSSSRNHWGKTRYRPASSRSTGSKSEQLPLSSCCICPASGLRNLIENGTAIQFIIWYFPANVYRCRNGIKFSSFSILFTDSKTSWLEMGVMIVRADFFSVPTLMARIQSWRKAHFNHHNIIIKCWMTSFILVRKILFRKPPSCAADSNQRDSIISVSFFCL